MPRSHCNHRSRRRLLAAIGTGVVGGLAGCSDDDRDDPNVADPDAGFDFTVEHPVDEPKAFADDQLCGVCSMTVTDYSDRNCQVAHEDGVGMMCCSPGCMFAYYAEPTHFGGSDAEIVGAWVTDFDTGQLSDGFEAFYVLEHDERRVDDPMDIDPRVYANRSTAVEYVEQYDDLKEDDIVSLSDVDTDIARIYRDTRLP
ncbi:nitrous oxide reductase accessory protein NosL [Natronorubrum sp. A-ect3]|uniref:nitrous oxide reductase accessory protein NosL n=1 Tax=Natronorubrum sp. A-ect3 TaxID=3242698 RepID=UPI00359CD5EC